LRLIFLPYTNYRPPTLIPSSSGLSRIQIPACTWNAKGAPYCFVDDGPPQGSCQRGSNHPSVAGCELQDSSDTYPLPIKLVIPRAMMSAECKMRRDTRVSCNWQGMPITGIAKAHSSFTCRQILFVAQSRTIRRKREMVFVTRYFPRSRHSKHPVIARRTFLLRLLSQARASQQPISASDIISDVIPVARRSRSPLHEHEDRKAACFPSPDDPRAAFDLSSTRRGSADFTDAVRTGN